MLLSHKQQWLAGCMCCERLKLSVPVPMQVYHNRKYQQMNNGRRVPSHLVASNGPTTSGGGASGGVSASAALAAAATAAATLAPAPPLLLLPGSVNLPLAPMPITASDMVLAPSLTAALGMTATNSAAPGSSVSQLAPCHT